LCPTEFCGEFIDLFRRNKKSDRIQVRKFQQTG